MAKITAVKLEKKKVYLQYKNDSTWSIVQLFPRNEISSFLPSFEAKLAEITKQMDPHKSEGIRTTQNFIEDYKFISESETEVSLLNSEFGKLIRVKNDESFFKSPINEVFEEEGFETDKTDDEDEFINSLHRNKKRIQNRLQDGRNKSVEENSDELERKETTPTNRKAKASCSQKKALVKPQMKFFFNRKKRTMKNWKLERAIRIAETKVEFPVLKSIKIKKKSAMDANKIEKDAKYPMTKDKKAVKAKTEQFPEVKVDEKISTMENVPETESEDKKEGDSSDQRLSKEVETLTLGQGETNKSEKAIAKKQYELVVKKQEKNIEDSTESFEGLTMEAPNMVSSFDILFGNRSFF